MLDQLLNYQDRQFSDFSINNEIIKEVRDLKEGIEDVNRRLDDLENT